MGSLLKSGFLNKANYKFFKDDFYALRNARERLCAHPFTADSAEPFFLSYIFCHNFSRHNRIYFIYFFYMLVLGLFFVSIRSLSTVVNLDKTKPDYFSLRSYVVDAKPLKKKRLLQKVKRGKKNLLSARIKSLTKKQKLKVRLAKAGKVIWPSTRKYQRKVILARNTAILPSCLSPSVSRLVHDGYSWVSVKLPINALYKKVGFLAFKTRSLSPIKVAQKSLEKTFPMGQKSTYKIKLVKVKRKK